MTAGVLPLVAVRRRPVLPVLAAIEIRWYARRLTIWLAFAMSGAISLGTNADWQSGAYTEKIVSVIPLGAVAFVTALRAAGRDTLRDGAQFASTAPIGRDIRAAARLIGLAVPTAMAALVALAIGVVSRIEGGYWIGDGRWRTDTALHPWYELVQLPLTVAVLGAFGALLGATVRHRWLAPAGVAGGLVVLLGSTMWWVWNIPPIHSVAIFQGQPLQIDIPDSVFSAGIPDHWLAEGPNEFGDGWRRMVVHGPTIIAHDVYLVGLGLVLAGATIRSQIGRRMASIGAVVVVAAVATQIAVYPTL